MTSQIFEPPGGLDTPVSTRVSKPNPVRVQMCPDRRGLKSPERSEGTFARIANASLMWDARGRGRTAMSAGAERS